VQGVAGGGGPLPGSRVFALVTRLGVLPLPFVSGIDWSLAGELVTIGTYFALAVVWDYLWFVLNPAYTVHRFRKGSVWWFEKPWIGPFPIDYYSGVALCMALSALGAWSAGSSDVLYRQLWMLAGFAVLIG